LSTRHEKTAHLPMDCYGVSPGQPKVDKVKNFLPFQKSL